jgi:eukaryotic-like serine/threonine-protein kinase
MGNRPRSDELDLTHSELSSRSVGSDVGPYRLLEKLGEGGMGEVWLAEQREPVRRQVALKLIKPGLDTAQVVARFQAERQALALMNHPGIAKVFDAGATEQGRPYFAMEFVRGEPITAYCDRQRLTTQERLELFIQVCEAIQHAHQKGIIHRDLKPSNILVTLQDDRPVPKIIDFGVAKAMSQPLVEQTLYTSLTGFVGTPEYMSPEQAEMGGADIDTRTDVYALGVVLYELLTGSLPFDRQLFREKGIDDIRRTIREVEPRRPSTRVTHADRASAEAATRRRTEPARLAGLLRGDLDWITMRALEKDRTRRYDTVVGLAADVRRHLRSEPVSAGPPSGLYRARKFAGRHRFGVIGAAVSLILLVAFAATMAVQAQRIARERDRANREAEVARQVSEFLIGLFTVADPSEARGNSITAREVLDRGAARITNEVNADPGTRVRLLTTMGSVYTSLGLYGAATPLLEQAVETSRGALERDNADALTAMSKLGNLYWQQGHYSRAESLYAQLVEDRQRTLGAIDPDTLGAQFGLASSWLRQGRYAEAEQLLRATLEAQRSSLGPEHPDTLASLNNLLTIFFFQGRYADALPLAVDGLEAFRRVQGDEHPRTLNAMNNLASVYLKLEQFDRAEPLFVGALAKKRRVLGEMHPETCNGRLTLAYLYSMQGRHAEAEPLLLLAHEGYVASFGRSHEMSRKAIDRLVTLYEDWNKREEATKWRELMRASTK